MSRGRAEITHTLHNTYTAKHISNSTLVQDKKQPPPFRWAAARGDGMDAPPSEEERVARALSLIGLGQLIAGQREGEDLVRLKGRDIGGGGKANAQAEGRERRKKGGR